MAKINRMLNNGTTYELQDYELNNKLSSFSGVVKNASGTLSQAVAGTDYDYPVLKGTGAPTTSTKASVGQRYVNTSATAANGVSAEYVCTAVSGSTYTWVAVGSAGHIVASTAPSNTSVLWVNSSTGVMSYYNGSTWVACTAVWG